MDRQRFSIAKMVQDGLNRVLGDQPRDYIGASSIGHDCYRHIWYRYNDNESQMDLSSKKELTFLIGHRLEEMMIKLIQQSGTSIIPPSESNHYLEVFDSEIPEFRGHMDAILYSDVGVKSVLEIKTARDSSFRIFVKNGLKHWNKAYYSQLQAYMGMSGLIEGYLLALNKDTSELHDEWVEFDPNFYLFLKEKAKRILLATEAPNRVNNSELYYLCRLCDYNKICHRNK